MNKMKADNECYHAVKFIKKISEKNFEKWDRNWHIRLFDLPQEQRKGVSA